MLHSAAAITLGLVLLVPSHASASPGLDAADPRAGAPATKARDVSLGHRPVPASSRARVRLTFEGRKGQLVQLARRGNAETCGARVLRTARGKVVKPWAQGYWRLSRTATYTAVSKPCTRLPKQKVTLRLRRVVQHDAAVAGVATTLGKGAKVTRLVPVRVGVDQEVGVTSSTPVAEVIGPDRKTSVPDGSTPLVLRAPGRHWLAPQPGTTLRTSLTVRHSAQVDGQRIALPAMGTSSTTQSVGFSGQAGQWVYAELLDASATHVANDTTRAISVFGPDGREVQDAILHDCSQMNANDGCTVRGPWLLKATGAYTMTISADRPEAERPTVLRVRAAAVAPDLTINGPVVTYASTSPGQWVVGRYPETPYVVEPGFRGTGVYLEAGNISASLGAWNVTAAAGLPFWSLNCWDKACDYRVDHLDPGRLRIETPYPGLPRNESWALLVVPPNAQGSMDLTLTEPPR